jgi:hypothetical protein
MDAVDFVHLLKLWLKRLSESGLSCALVMTQGNPAALSLDHWMVALSTGWIAATATVFLILFKCEDWLEDKWKMAGTIGFFTAVSDMLMHPSGFGGPATEAIVTGIGAGLLCFVMGKVYDRS